VVNDQVIQGRLEEVAEPAAVGAGPPVVPADDPEGELLVQVGGRVRVADGPRR
jgi:hypothetical protein